MDEIKLNTSFFARSGSLENAVSIAVFPPSWYTGEQFRDLAPKPDMIRLCDMKVYTERFYNEILSRNIAWDVADRLQGKVLLCFEKPGEFCHRRLVAEWIQRETGIIVPEILTEKELHPQISLF